ncbi:MAG: hypothetical protein IMZ61_01275, partial [Planctomycetes bacterium]|nr:hypothetical protein [Planctomycetota bacterium]
SQGEIIGLLEDFGATAVFMMTGATGGKLAWMVRFQWNDKSYRFTFTPLQCRFPGQVNSYGGKRRSHEDQAKYQMGRIAIHFVKAILTAAEATPASLFGFLELPGARPGSIPPTAAELNVEGLTAALPALDFKLLTKGDEDGQ